MSESHPRDWQPSQQSYLELCGCVQELRKVVNVQADKIDRLVTLLTEIRGDFHRHSDALGRIGHQVDDHESRIRVLESSRPSSKAITSHEDRLRVLETQGATTTEKVTSAVKDRERLWWALAAILSGAGGSGITTLLGGG